MSSGGGTTGKGTSGKSSSYKDPDGRGTWSFDKSGKVSGFTDGLGNEFDSGPDKGGTLGGLSLGPANQQHTMNEPVDYKDPDGRGTFGIDAAGKTKGFHDKDGNTYSEGPNKDNTNDWSDLGHTAKALGLNKSQASAAAGFLTAPGYFGAVNLGTALVTGKSLMGHVDEAMGLSDMLDMERDDRTPGNVNEMSPSQRAAATYGGMVDINSNAVKSRAKSSILGGQRMTAGYLEQESKRMAEKQGKKKSVANPFYEYMQ